ncbi:FAD binding domain-containing protein [Armillaria fumosa]|nr:FAD binding domain-containing protein [Armillaria fumosa]
MRGRSFLVFGTFHGRGMRQRDMPSVGSDMQCASDPFFFCKVASSTTDVLMTHFDCIVVGSGHAGSCAALSSLEAGCQKGQADLMFWINISFRLIVLIVDKCPPAWVGGNGYFTAGAHRTVHGGLQDLLPIVNNLSSDIVDRIDMEPYTRDHFFEDIMRLGNGKADSALVSAVVDNSRDAMQWLAQSVKVPFVLSFNRQAYEVHGRQKFWGGMVLSVDAGGKGLIAAHQHTLGKAGVELWFDTPCVELLREGNAISGIVVRRNGINISLKTSAVILAAGGFEASSKLRTRHLGPEWERVKVRGTPYNTGDGFQLARAVGAKFTGDWAGCHNTAWDADAPDDTGTRDVTNQYTKSGYPLGVMVNSDGARFVDEGEDFRNYTYAKFGRAILSQPGGIAFQIWDAKVVGSLRKEEYGDGIVEKMMANSIEELARELSFKGLKTPDTLIQTLKEFNAAVERHQREFPNQEWDPAIKDGLSTQSSGCLLDIPKSNWALPINQPPFMAVKVCCGITFTFGGLAIDPDTAGVISEESGQPIPGLFCTGEMVGGLFYNNYPGGSGLTAGAVFGRKAGASAAKLRDGGV